MSRTRLTIAVPITARTVRSHHEHSGQRHTPGRCHETQGRLFARKTFAETIHHDAPAHHAGHQAL